MDSPTALLTHHLHDLGPRLEAVLDLDGPPVAEALAALIAGLHTAVTSYRGLQVTLTEHGHPVVLTAFGGSPRPDRPADHADRVGTSLRLPLRLLDPGFASDSRVVFYAARPGAFVDLAADLAYALTRGAGMAGPTTWPPTGITLDTDLPPPGRGSSISGLAELSCINRATGVLLDRGQHPGEVHAGLRRDAAAAGLSPYAFAVRLLRGPRRPGRALGPMG